ncbi:MAG: antitoxin MazE-like protein [Rubrivivax sp.]
MVQPLPTVDKMTRHRQRLRAAGLRPVQFWVADTREPAFTARLRAQCLQLQGDAAEADAARFAEAAAELVEGWR